ncbi:hypothetical protein ENSA5_18690 [Enhygromyxa salina]|uniref:Uncharacterized protein n=1 Tax=Enhygromyxa salina TaxID=215803 RepID=A0A2S9YCT4_9BACT|nr:hypothetical protein [Enhygromyxa salina]PRQ02930.1 hypothetical protein ENSA5_18690 [Enhygromyxa salina]
MDELPSVYMLHVAGRHLDAAARCRELISEAVRGPEAEEWLKVLVAQILAGLSSIARGEHDQAWIDPQVDMRDHSRALTGRGLEAVIGEVHEPEIRRDIAHWQACLVELAIAQLGRCKTVNKLAARAQRVAKGADLPLARAHAEYQLLRALRYIGRHERAVAGWCSLARDLTTDRDLAVRSLAEAVATLQVTAPRSSTYAQTANELRRLAAEQDKPWPSAVVSHLAPTRAPMSKARAEASAPSSDDRAIRRLCAAAWFDALPDPGRADVDDYVQAIASGPLASRLYYPWQSLLRRRPKGVVPTALSRHLDELLATIDPQIVTELDLPRCSFEAYERRDALARIIGF